MVAFSKVVLEEFKILLVKMAKNATANEFAVVNYELLCDIEIIMGHTCLFLMLEALQGLSKYAQNREIFICDFMGNVKFCQANLHNTYCDEVQL